MAEPAAAAPSRLRFLDGVRGLALIFMAVNHTGHWWIDRSMGWGRHYLVYTTLTLAAPLFLFLVGFCLALPFERARPAGGPGGAASLAWRGVRIVAAGLLLNLLLFPEDPVWTGGVLQTIGLSLVVMAPLARASASAAGRACLVAAAAGYAAFAWAYPVPLTPASTGVLRTTGRTSAAISSTISLALP